jgi:hypothetical protein
MSIKNTIIIPALPDTWQISKASRSTDLNEEGFKQQVIAWAIIDNNQSDTECGFTVRAITALDLVTSHFNDTNGNYQEYSCNNKLMNPHVDGETYQDLIDQLD